MIICKNHPFEHASPLPVTGVTGKSFVFNLTKIGIKFDKNAFFCLFFGLDFRLYVASWNIHTGTTQQVEVYNYFRTAVQLDEFAFQSG